MEGRQSIITYHDQPEMMLSNMKIKMTNNNLAIVYYGIIAQINSDPSSPILFENYGVIYKRENEKAN